MLFMEAKVFRREFAGAFIICGAFIIREKHAIIIMGREFVPAC
jgi:hypothetical protein